MIQSATRIQVASDDHHEAGLQVFGRDSEFNELQTAVRDHRLVSVVGPPGIGKSWLLATALPQSDRVRWCSLADVTNAVQLSARLCECLGVEAGRSGITALLKADVDLVVFDAPEGVLDDLTEVLRLVIRPGGDLHVVVCTRRVIEHAMMKVVRIGPLESEAAEALFLEHAGVYTIDATLVAAIVEHLDYHPLAIRVVASRVRLLGAEGLLRTLTEDRWTWLLTAGALARVVRTAWEQMSDTVRDLLRQAQVFQGGFDLAAAEAVFDIGADVTAALVALDNGSWLRTLHSEFPPRLQVFRVLEAFVALDASPLSADTVRRHAQHYNRMAAQMAAMGERGARWMSVELDNLRAAVDATSDPEERARATLNLVSALWRGGWLKEIISRTQHAEAGVSAPLRARLLRHRARSRIRLGQIDLGRDEAMQALDLAQEQTDLPLAQQCADVVSTALLVQGRCAEVLALHKANKLQLSLRTRAAERYAAGAFREAGQIRELAMTHAMESGDPDGRAELAAELALDIAAEDRERALTLLESARSWWERTFNVGGMGLYWQNLGLTRLLQADWRGAEAALVQAAQRDLDPRSRLIVDVALGEAYLGMSQLDSAIEALNRGVWAARRNQDQVLPRALCVRAGVHALQRRPSCFASDLATATQVLRGRGDTEGLRLVAWMGAYPALANARRWAEIRDLSSASEALKRFDTAHSPEQNERSPMLIKQMCTLSALRHQLIADHPDVLTGMDIVVAQDLSSVHLPSEESVNLANLGPPRRLLGALLKARTRGTGAADRDWLVTEVWSGERMTGASAVNRLRVAVSALRRLGLRDIVQTVPGGYRLNPTHRYRWDRLGNSSDSSVFAIASTSRATMNAGSGWTPEELSAVSP
ncbi:MAG: hypothetical protein GWP91_26110 [Rhodobacterales bacterium]|nr:hypothetical protein [Rhodobacterales bacterium]